MSLLTKIHHPVRWNRVSVPCRSRHPTVLVKSIFEKFSEKSIKSAMMAQTEAILCDTEVVMAEHLFLGILASESYVSSMGFLGTRMDLKDARKAVEKVTSMKFSQSKSRWNVSSEVPFHEEVRDVFAFSYELAKGSGDMVHPEHIFLAMYAIDGCDTKIAAIITAMGLDPNEMRSKAEKKLVGDVKTDTKKPKLPSHARKSTGALDTFCRDLTKEAKENKIDPVIGRDTQLMRVVQILTRRTKNNPILIGDAGVGKTAIVEAIAHLIATGKQLPDGSPLPDKFNNKRLLMLDTTGLIAGTKERGELEERLTNIIREVREAEDVILFIDEVHLVIGSGGGRAGDSSNQLNMANIMKPPLARGELQCIGATTLDEHRMYIESDAALERRFQPVMVGEPTKSEAIDILHGIQQKYERHHRVLYTKDAVNAAVNLSIRFVTDRRLPDKAIDLLDEAGSAARMTSYVTSKRRGDDQGDVKKRVSEYFDLIDEKGMSLQLESYERAAQLLKRELQLQSELAGSPEEGSPIPIVMEQHIKEALSQWKGIPIDSVCLEEGTRLNNLEKELHRTVLGQPHAVDVVMSAMRRAGSNIRDPKRPIATMLFVGPTGVGKTYLAKAIARGYMGSEKALIRFDMSEFMEAINVSRLIGSPPGYVGHGEGGELTEAVRRKPFSVLLFDEIEKAHPDIYNIMLQILEDGRLTDSSGRVVSFRETIIILTSNIGSSSRRGASSSSPGFFARLESEEEEASPPHRTSEEARVLSEVSKHFRPELVNRFDEQVVFESLQRNDTLRHILVQLLDEMCARALQRGYTVAIGDGVVDYMLQKAKGECIEYGARPLKRLVTTLIEDPLSDRMLRRNAPAALDVCMNLHKMGIMILENQPCVTCSY